MDEFYSSPQPIDLHSISALQEIPVREGISLRPLAQSDAPSILEILDADPEIRDRVYVASLLHTPEDVTQEVERIAADPNLLRFSIENEGHCVGLISFWRDIDNPVFDDVDNPNDYGFGYFLDPSERGKGLVTDAVQAVIGRARDNLHIRQFIAYCEDNNPESISVLINMGFQPQSNIPAIANNGWLAQKYILSSGKTS